MLGLPHIQTYYQQSRLRIITGSLKKLHQRALHSSLHQEQNTIIKTVSEFFF